MKSRDEILMDFDRAMEQVERLHNIAKDMRTVAEEEVGATLTKIQADWTGDNADAFLVKGKKHQDKINGDASKLDHVANKMQEIATIIKNAELAAISIAKR